MVTVDAQASPASARNSARANTRLGRAPSAQLQSTARYAIATPATSTRAGHPTARSAPPGHLISSSGGALRGMISSESFDLALRYVSHLSCRLSKTSMVSHRI
jgi:hypothetical protein